MNATMVHSKPKNREKTVEQRYGSVIHDLKAVR
jgi:hypothetical protein